MKKVKKLLTTMAFIILIGSASYASSDIVVALDPGHGGTEPGASYGGLVEKDITWKLATRVKSILDNTAGITGILTKQENETLFSRQTRAERARDNNADLLVSFHINSNDSSNNLSGAEVYVTNDTKQKRYYEYSNTLGLNILQNLRNVGVSSFSFKPKIRVGSPDDVYPDGTVADYYGIISWPMHFDIPSVLVEHCFINNPYDRNNYLNDAMITKMAEADAKAIINNKELFRRNYEGSINTDLKTMQIGTESNGRNYITGEVLIAEWVNGVANVPKDLPQMTIKSTDGTFSAGVNLVHNGGLSYSYYRIIDNLDTNKEYYLEATLTSKQNTSNNKTQLVKMPNMSVGTFKDTTLKTKNNKLYFSIGEYVGDINTDLKSIDLVKENENNYLDGNILIAEWINGVAKTPKVMPKLTLKSTDKTVTKEISLVYDSGLNYKYDIKLDNIDISKQYYIEAELTSEENISTRKTQKVLLPNKELGKYNGKTITLEDNEIKFTYVGAINTDLKTIKLGTNEIGRHYIYGEILIAEWIDGKVNTPSDLPEMTIKSTDGSYSTGIHLVYNGGISYTYDRIIDNLDTSKEYYIEAKLTGKNNTGSSKTQKVKFANQEIGKYDQVRLIAEDNKLKMTDGSLYEGTINTDVKTMYVAKNEAGREYIHGNILIAEWINGAAYTPNGLPEMTLKSTDGTYSAGMHLVHEGGLNYYYDRVIFNLDTSKEYYIEVKLTSNKNIGKNKQQNANINVAKNIGMFKEKNMMIENNKIVFKGNEYEGVVNTDLKTMYIAQNEVGREYIHGNILIAEWINGVACIPNKLPEMTLKSTDGTYSAGMHLVHESGLNYYYDRVIFNLDTSKEYYIEVKLTNSNNISNKKSQQANLNAKANVGIFKETSEIVLVNNKITFKSKEKAKLVTMEEPDIVEEEQKEVIEENNRQEEMENITENTAENVIIKGENTIQENETTNVTKTDNTVKTETIEKNHTIN